MDELGQFDLLTLAEVAKVVIPPALPSG